ncbi:MAG: ABC transporter permease [Gemmatimonadales bacterium]
MNTTAVSRRAAVPDLVLTLGAFLLGLALLLAFLSVAGFDAAAGLAALWRGAFGSRYALLSATLVPAAPLLLLGLAFALAARAGALNIGMEGQFAMGAIGATWVGLAVGGWSPLFAIPAVLAAGLLAGAAWIVVPVVLRWRFGVTEVISTLLLNFVAEAAVSWAVTGPLQEASRSYPQSDPIAMSARLPRLLPPDRVHLGFVVALAIAAVLWVILARHRLGFVWRAVGASPRAATVTGRLPVERVAATVLLLSGALAGLGGAIEVSGVSAALYQNLSPGYGFTAIAVALLGRLHPAGIVVAAILFGALQAGAGAMQRDAGIPAVAVHVVQAVVILVMLLATRRRG